MNASPSEQAVLIHISTSGVDPRHVFNVEDDLTASVDGQGLGEVDGNDVALDGSEVIYYIYGPDADAIFAAVEPVIRRFPPGSGSYAIKRYGEADDPDAREVRLDLTPGFDSER